MDRRSSAPLALLERGARPATGDAMALDLTDLPAYLIADLTEENIDRMLEERYGPKEDEDSAL